MSYNAEIVAIVRNGDPDKLYEVLIGITSLSELGGICIVHRYYDHIPIISRVLELQPSSGAINDKIMVRSGLKTLRHLFDHDLINPNTTHGGASLLHNMVWKGSPERVKLLLDSGADINAQRQRDGYTALHIAEALGNVPCTQLLLKRGADTTIKDANGYTYLEVMNNYTKPQ